MCVITARLTSGWHQGTRDKIWPKRTKMTGRTSWSCALGRLDRLVLLIISSSIFGRWLYALISLLEAL